MLKEQYKNVKWHKFPEEKPSVTGEYLLRGIGGLNNKLHHWVCLWVAECDEARIANRFFYGGNEFNNVPSGRFEWLDLKDL